MLERDFNLQVVETHTGSMPPLRRVIKDLLQAQAQAKRNGYHEHLKMAERGFDPRTFGGLCAQTR